LGIPEWQVVGAIELFKLIDEGAPEADIADVGDYKKITGADQFFK
jgi:hypothetical protein